MIQPHTTIRIWRRGNTTFANDGKGQNFPLYTEPKRGARVVDYDTFQAALRAQEALEAREAEPTPDDTFLAGLILGAACMFCLAAGIIFVAWCWV